MLNLLLALDIGNTTTLVGVYDNELLIDSWRFSAIKEKTGDELGILITSALKAKGIEPDSIGGVIVSCVVPSVINSIRIMCKSYLGCIPIEVDPEHEEYVPLAYPDPKQIGADRIVNAVAAVEKYGPPLIIIDFGTATTFCAISEKGEFMGGCIVPGIGICQEALVERAERLLPVSWETPGCVIAKSTDDAIRAGILFGYASMVDGIVVKMKQEMGESPKVVATGGWSAVIQKETKYIEVIDPYLTLEGLRIIYARRSKPPCT